MIPEVLWWLIAWMVAIALFLTGWLMGRAAEYERVIHEIERLNRDR